MSDGLWAVAVVFGLLGLLHVLLRASGAAARTGVDVLRIVSSCALGPRKRLHVVEVDGVRLLVSSSESGVALLRDLPSKPSVDAVEDVPAEPAVPIRRRLERVLRAGAAVVLFAASLGVVVEPASAQPTGDLVFSIDAGAADAGSSSALEMLALLTILSVAPSILLMMTCFTRVVIVLAFVRQALGVQHLPPNQVLVGLAMFVTFFVMAPLGAEIRDEAYRPYAAKEIDIEVASERALAPLRRFMLSHTRESDLALFVEMSAEPAPETIELLSTATLLPAFLISELRTAFEIGFVIFLPFLVIDLVVSSMLISMGMIVLPPMVVALPFKVMLFVLADGWNMVLGSVVAGLR